MHEPDVAVLAARVLDALIGQVFVGLGRELAVVLVEDAQLDGAPVAGDLEPLGRRQFFDFWQIGDQLAVIHLVWPPVVAAPRTGRVRFLSKQARAEDRPPQKNIK